ncbi:hypothetical protein LTS10_004190 [Elasticomyces elasticus]|nr:hypothetical protein LTS10_004190 [Elasticomyces elasticus]
MAPGFISDMPNLSEHVKNTNGHSASREPLRLSGALDKFEHEDVTPVIGREYPKINIVNDLLDADNADELVRELAIQISQRGVVFFRAQDNLTDELQKHLVNRLGQLSRKPSSSSLHIHPVL